MFCCDNANLLRSLNHEGYDCRGFVFYGGSAEIRQQFESEMRKQLAGRESEYVVLCSEVRPFDYLIKWFNPKEPKNPGVMGVDVGYFIKNGVPLMNHTDIQRVQR
ncbi:hypothetical protein J4463_00985 [Candidatus Pacearchaeota archaeon]|nr:hypothetical protein [Candidatus Pacearchaeota archaeon]